MSGGQLVVMDRSGRDVKRYSLPEGLVTLGSDPDCDIRVMLPAVYHHHATVVVHANQTVVRNVSDGETLVNGRAVSVAALKHGDVITLGDRSLRWEYYEPTASRPIEAQPVVYVKRKAKGGRGRKRASEAAPRRLVEPSVRLALEMKSRASMPGATKQVAIVQPQRRVATVDSVETKARLITKPHRPYAQPKRTPRASTSAANQSRTPRKLARSAKTLQTRQSLTNESGRNASLEADMSINENNPASQNGRKKKSSLIDTPLSRNSTPKIPSNSDAKSGRKSKISHQVDTSLDTNRKTRNSKSVANIQSNTLLETSTETKASQWIASRKSSPRNTPKHDERTKPETYVHVDTPRPKVPYVEMSPSKMSASSTPRKIVITTKRNTLLRTAVLRKTVSPRISNRSLVVDRNTPKSDERTTTERYVHVATPRPKAPYVEKSPSKMLASSTPRKIVITTKRNTPLRTAVLRRTMTPRVSNRSLVASVKKPQSVSRLRVPKIEEPLKIDDHKKAALMLLTRTPKLKQQRLNTVTPTSTKTPQSSLIGRKTPQSMRKSSTKEMQTSASVLEITDTEERRTRSRNTSKPSSPEKSQHVSLPPSPRKSAMKDSSIRNPKKNESIKFDLSNLESHSHDESDVLVVSNTMYEETNDSGSYYLSEDDLTLHYSSSPSSPPSPRKSIKSRSSRIMEKTLGETFSIKTPKRDSPVKSVISSTSPRKSLRSSLMVQKALQSSFEELSNSSAKRSESRKSTMSVGNNTEDKSKSLRNMETYSIVDLVSLDTNDTGISPSVCDSVRSSVAIFGTPKVSETRMSTLRRKGASSMTPSSHIGTSTPYITKIITRKSTTRSQSALDTLSSETGASPRTSVISRRSRSLIGRSSRYRNVDDSNLSLAKSTLGRAGDTFTKTISLSTRNSIRRALTDTLNAKDDAPTSSSSIKSRQGESKVNSTSMHLQIESNEPSTPPEYTITTSEAGTPVLNMKDLLNASNLSMDSERAVFRNQRGKRKTIALGATKRKSATAVKSLWTDPKRVTRVSRVSQINPRKIALLSQKKALNDDSSVNSDKTDENAPIPDNEENVTPKGTVNLVLTGVKERHSTAKKPVSKRTIIDDLNQSDIVKQLFNSPVKRKLSQNMTEFGKSELSDSAARKKRLRTTTALTGRTPNQSTDFDNVATPQVPMELFVSPMVTPNQSPNLSGLKRLFAKNTPENDLRDVRGVRRLLKTPSNKPSGDYLTDVFGVKRIFRKSPRNDLTHLKGVKDLFAPGPADDLRNVTGVKRIMMRSSPKNDLTNVRGVKRLFRLEQSRNDSGDSTEADDLFRISRRDLPKTFCNKTMTPTKTLKAAHSLIESADISDRVEEWLEKEIQMRTRRGALEPATSIANVSLNRELKKLNTDTVVGGTPILKTRTRHSIVNNSRSRKSGARLSDLDRNSLPIKKRSIVLNAVGKDAVVETNASLPIKKRAILHSTPVKGRHALASNVSELGRVSPIFSDNKQPDLSRVTPKNSSSQIKTKPERTKKVNAKDSSPKISPKKVTRAKRVTKTKLQKSPVVEVIVTRTRRGNKTNSQATTVTKSSLVINEISLPMDPKVVITKASPKLRGRKAKANNVDKQPTNASPEKKESPIKTTRTTRGRKAGNKKTEQIPKDTSVKKPKQTRSRAQNKRNSLQPAIIISKPSPSIKPQIRQTRSRKPVQESPIKDVTRTEKAGKLIEKQPPKTRQKRNVKTENTPSIVTSPNTTRKTKVANEKVAKQNKVDSTSELPVDKPKRVTRGRKVASNAKPADDKTEIKNDASVAKVGRGRKRIANDVEPISEIAVPRKTRKTVKEEEEDDKPKKSRNKKLEESPKKPTGRRTKKDVAVEKENVHKGRKRNSDQNVESAPSGRGKRVTATKKTKEEVPLPVNTRGRKNISEIEGATARRSKRRLQ